MFKVKRIFFIIILLIRARKKYVRCLMFDACARLTPLPAVDVDTLPDSFLRRYEKRSGIV